MARFSKTAALLFILAHLVIFSQAQKIMVFDRDASSVRIRFKVCDEISVKINGRWIEGEIAEINDSAIIIGDNYIIVSQISAIKYDSRSSWTHLCTGLAAALPIAGAGLLAIDAINSVANHSYPIYSDNTLITAGSMIVIVPILYRLTYHKFKINKHHRLKVIDVSIR